MTTDREQVRRDAPELDELRRILREADPSFSRVDEILIALAFDESVSTAVYDQLAEAVFIVLMAYAAERNARG